MPDVDTINTELEAVETADLRVIRTGGGPEDGSNLIRLTPALVREVLRKLREHPELGHVEIAQGTRNRDGKSLSPRQVRLIDSRRQAILAQRD